MTDKKISLISRSGLVLLRRLAALIVCSGMALGGWPAKAVPGIETQASHLLLIDHDTGTVLAEKRADEPMPPASMSKLMTIAMVFDRLRDGSLKMDDKFPVSAKAWRKGGSKMFVEVDKFVSVSDLLRGIIVQSGNDACIVVAEGLGGSESAFATLMNEQAALFGLANSSFANATGWPDPGQRMSARDLATLASIMVREYSDYYSIFAETEFTFSNIRQPNRNPLLGRVDGADGLKTGHTEESGYGLTASAIRDGRRLVLVANGLDSQKQRATESARVLEWGFREFANYRMWEDGQIMGDADVWLGAENVVPLVVDKALTITLPRRARRNMTVTMRYTGPIPAPIRQGQKLAELEISSKDGLIDPITVPLMAAKDVDQLGGLGRLSAGFNYLLWGNVGR